MANGIRFKQLRWGTMRGPGLNNEFPKFEGADVKIIVSASRQYELHSSVLTNASPLMKEFLLTDENAARLSSKAIKKHVTTKWRLELIKNPGRNEDGSYVDYVLEPVLLNEDGKALASNVVSLEFENGRAVNPTFLV